MSFLGWILQIKRYANIRMAEIAWNLRRRKNALHLDIVEKIHIDGNSRKAGVGIYNKIVTIYSKTYRRLSFKFCHKCDFALNSPYLKILFLSDGARFREWWIFITSRAPRSRPSSRIGSHCRRSLGRSTACSACPSASRNSANSSAGVSRPLGKLDLDFYVLQVILDQHKFEFIKYALSLNLGNSAPQCTKSDVRETPIWRASHV